MGPRSLRSQAACGGSSRIPPGGVRKSYRRLVSGAACRAETKAPLHGRAVGLMERGKRSGYGASPMPGAAGGEHCSAMVPSLASFAWPSQKSATRCGLPVQIMPVAHRIIAMPGKDLGAHVGIRRLHDRCQGAKAGNDRVQAVAGAFSLPDRLSLGWVGGDRDAEVAGAAVEALAPDVRIGVKLIRTPTIAVPGHGLHG